MVSNRSKRVCVNLNVFSNLGPNLKICFVEFRFRRKNSDPNLKKPGIKLVFSQNKFRFGSEFVNLFGIKLGLNVD